MTWDNPDITLSKGGVPVGSANLEPSTTYEVTARIWNNSLEAPVIAMPVHLSFLDFGVGTEPIPIATTARFRLDPVDDAADARTLLPAGAAGPRR